MRAIGEQKKFDRENSAQNSFLNRGKVLVSPAGDYYHVSMFAPTPTVQRFSSQGQFLSEFPIEGAAVNRQRGNARAFLNTKTAEMVGGVRVINSAAIDPLTGHIWVSTNGSSVRRAVSSDSGVLYEYDSNGAKLAEYALALKAPLAAGAVTDVRDFTVRGPWIHVLTSQGKVYRFNTNDRSAQEDNGERKPAKMVLASFTQNFWSEASSMLAAILEPEPELCEQEQTYTCVANCPSNSPTQTVNCGSELRARMAESDRIVSGTCNQGPGGCEGTINTCNTG